MSGVLESDQLVCFSDGSSSRKTNCIGSGVVLYKNEEEIESFDIGFKNCGRNGAAELIGMLFALEMLLPHKEKPLTIYCDAQYVVKAINEWSYKWVQTDFFLIKNIELILNVLYKRTLFSNLRILWVKGHQKDTSFTTKGNNRADKLAEVYKSSNAENLINFDDFILEITESKSHLCEIKRIVKEYYTYKRET